jgi:hypothetical protein
MVAAWQWVVQGKERGGRKRYGKKGGIVDYKGKGSSPRSGPCRQLGAMTGFDIDEML